MRNLTDIKYRIKGITDTRQITSAMETISVAKMRKAITRYESNLTYFNKVRSTIKDIIVHTSDTTHKYLRAKKEHRAVFLVIASDKGLAGGYNHNVLNAAYQKMSEFSEKYVFTVGHMASEFFEAKGMTIDVEFVHISLDPTIRDAAHIVDSIISLYEQDLMDEVYVVYTATASSYQHSPEIIKLLPLVKEEVIGDIDVQKELEKEEYFKELKYEPSADEVLSTLVPQYLTGIIYGALVQSVAAEHLARRTAMSNATKNADEILQRLTLEHNRARQETVTKELTEIITSSMGIKSSY